MRCGDEFLGIRAGAVFEARLETVRRILEYAGLGGNTADTFLETSLPGGRTLLDHDRDSSS